MSATSIQLFSSLATSSSSSFSTSPTSLFPSATTSTPSWILDEPAASRISYLSTTTTGLVAGLALMIGLTFLAVVSGTQRYAQRNPRVVNKASGVWVWKWAPSVYVLLVMSSLAEIATSSWLILQYRFNHNYPNVATRTAAVILLFASTWTCLTAGAYAVLFLHPAWSRHPVASVGAQAIWIFVTCVFWVAGSGLLNGAIPRLSDAATCREVVYCGQIRALFGLGVTMSFMLAAGMAALLWLAWQSAKSALEPVFIPMI